MTGPHQGPSCHLHLPELGQFPEADVPALSVETVALNTWVSPALQRCTSGALSQPALTRNRSRLQKLSLSANGDTENAR